MHIAGIFFAVTRIIDVSIMESFLWLLLSLIVGYFRTLPDSWQVSANTSCWTKPTCSGGAVRKQTTICWMRLLIVYTPGWLICTTHGEYNNNVLFLQSHVYISDVQGHIVFWKPGYSFLKLKKERNASIHLIHKICHPCIYDLSLSQMLQSKKHKYIFKYQ